MRPTAPRVQYVAEVIRLLWPEPWVLEDIGRGSGTRGKAPEHRSFYVFPGLSRPRLLVPVDVPAAAHMLRRLGKDRSSWARRARNVAPHAVRTPAFSLLRWPTLRLTSGRVAGGDSIERHLRDQLGVDVRVGIMLGTPRANQKPVLQMFGRDGSVIGFAKIGHNDLTAELVRNEARTLDLLGRRRPVLFETPRLLHHGQWQTLEVCAMSALSGKLGVHTPHDQRIAAMAELARLFGSTKQPLGASEYYRRLGVRVDRVHEGETRRRLAAGLRAIANRWSDAEVELGAWHGDWGHWNMALDGTVVQLWDWERFDDQVPIGFDGLHFRAQSVRPATPAVRQQEGSFSDSVPEELGAFGVPAALHEVTLALYLLEVGIRYATDLNHPTGEHVRNRCAWAIDFLERQLGTRSAARLMEGS